MSTVASPINIQSVSSTGMPMYRTERRLDPKRSCWRCLYCHKKLAPGSEEHPPVHCPRCGSDQHARIAVGKPKFVEVSVPLFSYT